MRGGRRRDREGRGVRGDSWKGRGDQGRLGHLVFSSS